MLYALIAALIFAVGMNWWDNLNTVACEKLGYVEGNSYIDWLVGNKPSLWQLIAISQGILAAIFVGGLFALGTPLAAAGVTGLVIAGVKHIIGARAGAKLLKK